MPTLLYSHPVDNVAASGTLTCESGTPEAMYPVENLFDLNPARPCKIAETTGTFLWDFGGAQRVDVFAIIHHNLQAGLTVRIQANATNSWGAPTLNTTLVIPAWWADGMPPNPLRVLTGVSGYSTGGFQFWRLDINSANNAPIALGDVLLLNTTRHMIRNPLWGLGLGEDRPIIEHVTDYLISTVYSYGVSRRRLSGSLLTTSAGAAELRTWWRACGGRALPFLLELDGGASNDYWLARFATSALDILQDGPGVYRAMLAFEEVGRGLPL